MLKGLRALPERHEPKPTGGSLEGCARSPLATLGIGWARDGARLFLSCALQLRFARQYSSAARQDGAGHEGRLTLVELVRRMRYSGHLNAQGITERDQFEVLEKLVEQLTGGARAVKLYYLIDRRDLLEKVKTVYARYAAS